jgi:AhpD family alkylhydroperoxidase
MSKRLDYSQIAPAGVKAVLIDLVYLRVSQINNCAYCLDMHTRDLLKKGQKIEKLALVQAWAEGGNLFDERERAALAWAETVTRVADTGVPDKDYQAARAVFEERELVDLTIAIGLMNTYNRMAISFRNTPQAVAEVSA